MTWTDLMSSKKIQNYVKRIVQIASFFLTSDFLYYILNKLDSSQAGRMRQEGKVHLAVHNSRQTNTDLFTIFF